MTIHIKVVSEGEDIYPWIVKLKSIPWLLLQSNWQGLFSKFHAKLLKYAPYPFPHIIQYKHFLLTDSLKDQSAEQRQRVTWSASSGPLRWMDGLARKFMMTPWTCRSGSVYVITVSMLRRPKALNSNLPLCPYRKPCNISASSSINVNQYNSPDISL